MKIRAILIGLAAVLVLACITINVYFPEAAIKDLSEQIEEQVAKEAGIAEAEEEAPTPTPSAEDQQSWLLPSPSDNDDDFHGFSLLGGSVAYAQGDEVAAPEVSNPAIRTIIESRAARLGAVNTLKTLGVVGENNQALIEVRSIESVANLRERAEVQRLVRAENKDREQLFKEIAAAKNVDLSQLPRIRTTYAETLRSKARKGDWIQLPDGTWKQK